MLTDPQTERPLVLVVDGDESVRRLLYIKLPKAGFSVVSATDAQSGLSTALARGPAIVLLDGMGPTSEAYELCSALARLPRERRPAIVFLSTVEGPGDVVERAIRSGCDDFIVKPFSPDELLHRLRVVWLRRRFDAEADLAEPVAVSVP